MKKRHIISRVIITIIAGIAAFYIALMLTR